MLVERRMTQIVVALLICLGGEREVRNLVMKRELSFGVLLLICFAVALFVTVPTRSLTDGSDYDPWADIDDNGSVNIIDITKVAKAFGTSGDPTKPVMVNSYGCAENASNFVLNVTEILNLTISTVGYRYVAVGIYASSKDSHQFEVFIGHKIAGKYVYAHTMTPTSDSTIHVVKPTWYENVHPSVTYFYYEVAFSELVLAINNLSADYYLTGSIAYLLTT